MATLDDLSSKSISDMTDEELQQFLRSIRGRRILPEKSIAERSKKAAMGKKKPKAIAAQSAMAMLSTLTLEQKQQLLDKLKEENNG